MGLFDKFRHKRAEGAVTLEELITGNSTMTVKLALQVPAVAWCVNMIASAVAMLPVKLYRKSGDEVEEITDDPRVMILNGDTGDTMNADNMRRRWVYDYLLRGSAFGYIEVKDGVPDKLIYIPENVVSVLKSENDYIRKRFSYMVNGEEILPYRMLKILRNSDGFGKGVGIVEESPLILETMFQLLKFQKNQVLKGGNKRGFLQSKGVVSKETEESIKKNWSNIYSDDMNVHKVMFLNGDIDFKEMSASSVEMQVNENVKTNDTEIMRLFGTLDGILSKDTVKNAVMPVLDAFEAAFDSDLLLEKEKADHYFAFDTKELTRGDMGERFSAYGMAIDKNIMQIDEVRKAEDLPPLGFNYIKLGLQDVLLNPETGEVYTPNTNATANMNALGKIGGESEDRAEQFETRTPVFGDGHRIIDNVGSGSGASASASETYGIPKKPSVTKYLTDEELSGKIEAVVNNDIKPSVGGGTIDIRKCKTGYNRDSNGNLYIPYDQKGNAFGMPNYYLPPKTYNRIRSKINTYYDSKHKGKRFSHYSTPKKTYYFENHGFDDFNIYDVED